MANEIASAYVSLIANMPGVKRDIERSLGGSDVQNATKKAGDGLGSKLLGGISGVLKTGAIAVGATAAAGLGTALVKGFSRLQSLDQATAKLDGLGHSAEGVDKIMSNALASVRGTAFGMDEAATTAAGAVAAGIKPGEDLENNLKLVADAATIAGTDMGSMGAIFNKVAASNKLQGDTIAQLHDAGVPALALVAEQMGVTAEEASDMASKGQIDFATFSAAMEKGLGGAALKSGDTFAGAMANVGASLGRVGAGLLDGIFPMLAPLLGAITTALGPLETAAAGVGDKIGQFLAPGIQFLTDALNGGIDLSGFIELVTTFSPLVNLFKILQPLLPLIFDTVVQIGSVLGGALQSLLPTVGALVSAFGGLAAQVLPALLPLIVGLVTTIADLASSVLPTLMPLVTLLLTTFGTLAAQVFPLLLPLITGLVTMIAGLAAQIIPMLLPVLTQVAGIFLELATTLAPMIGMILPVLAELLALVVPIFMQLLGAILPLLDPIMQLITPLLDLVMTILPPLLDLFVTLIGFAIVPLQLAMSALIPLITGVVEAIATFLAPVIESLTGILTGLITFLTGVFTGDWEMVWQGIQDIFGGIWDTVKSIATGALNFIIDLVNGAIDGINGLANGISDLTGGAIDISIPHIPRLAEGGVVKARPGGIIANIGEGRYDEAVVPLSPGVLNTLGGGGGGGGVTIEQHITSSYNPREIARETADELGWAVH